VDNPPSQGCAQRLKKLDETIVGSAPREEAYLILECAKPWPAKVKKMEGLVSQVRKILKGCKQVDCKLIACDAFPWPRAGGAARALLLRWDGRRALCRELTPDEPSIIQALNSEPAGEPKQIYLVCTHGSRDPCCGKLGVPIFKALCENSKRLTLQVSHLGGHRFAPVVAVFPEWRFYGHLDAESVLELDRSLENNEPYLRGYRGNGRYKKNLQVVEAALWEKFGSPPLKLTYLEGDKGWTRCRALLGDGTEIVCETETDLKKFSGFESCKDIKKGKESTLKVPVLKRLTVTE